MLASTETACSRPFVLHGAVNIIFIFRLTRQRDVIILMALICSPHPFDFAVCAHVHLTTSGEFICCSGEWERLFYKAPVFFRPVASWEQTHRLPNLQGPSESSNQLKRSEKKADSL